MFLRKKNNLELPESCLYTRYARKKRMNKLETNILYLTVFCPCVQIALGLLWLILLCPLNMYLLILKNFNDFLSYFFRPCIQMALGLLLLSALLIFLRNMA